jgi:hypothetical protein
MTYKDQIIKQNADETSDWFFDLPLGRKFERAFWILPSSASLSLLLFRIAFSELWLRTRYALHLA